MVRTPKGESRGVQPLWQEAWRMCLHKPSSLLFPLPSRKGARGMVPLLNGATQLKWWGESRTLLGSWAARNWAVTSVPNASFSHMESSQGRLCLAVWSAGAGAWVRQSPLEVSKNRYQNTRGPDVCLEHSSCKRSGAVQRKGVTAHNYTLLIPGSQAYARSRPPLGGGEPT